ncbi:MAG: DUF924 family protein [Halieaceae bacterium]|jgi:uncharacterized protein (DUF924 family)|nr:DUF924 family protein [Halieaceae bacterium]
MDGNSVIGAILDFWFGALDDSGLPRESRNALWFRGGEAVDNAIRTQFAGDVEAAIAGERQHWAETPDGTIALVLLLDQFTRNIYRNTPAAFSGDAAALALARETVARGADAAMPVIHRVFLYVPFEHAEDRVAQEEGLACFERLLRECPEPAREMVEGFQRYMVAHRDVIAAFGRFPHRNAILGRTSTAAEAEHLAVHGGF